MHSPFQTIGSLDALRSVQVQLLSALPDGMQKQEKIEWMQDTLAQFRYPVLNRADKGLVREYLQHMTGYSRAQIARYISDAQKQFVPVAGEVKKSGWKMHGVFATLLIAVLLLSRSAFSSSRASLLQVLTPDSMTTETGSGKTASRVIVASTLSTDANGSAVARPLIALTTQSVSSNGKTVRVTRVSDATTLLQHVASRRASRLALLYPTHAAAGRIATRPDILIERPVYPPQSASDNLHPAATNGTFTELPGIWASIGLGSAGQILMIENGRPVWHDFPYLEQIRTMAPQGTEPTRRAGGQRSGGAPQSSTTTTVINNTTTSTAPSGWTDGTNVVYLTDGSDSVGIGTLTPQAKLDVVGSISGASLYIASSIEGAGLTSCDAINQKLLWDSVTKTFTCGTDNAVGTGLSTATADLRYVKKQGDTMTGALVIDIRNGNLASIGLNVINTISGAVVHANKTLSTSGSLVFEGAASGSSLYLGTSLNGAGLVDCSTAGTSKLLWNSATGRFSCGTDTDTDTNTTYTAGQGLSLNGTIVTLNSAISGSLIRFTTISGSTVFAKNLLASSGSVSIEGNLTGATINGFGLQACNSASQKLLWNTATGKFECGADVDTDTNTTYTAGRGLGLNGTSFSLNATITGSLVRFTTISGSTIYGKDSVNSSGSITAEGAISGSTLFAGTSIKGAGLVDCSTAGTSKLLWNSATGRFSCGTDTDTNTAYTAGQGLSLNGTIVTLNSSLSGSLIRFTTISGSTVFAKNLLASSGSVSIEGNLTGATINGFGLQACNSASQKLLWNTTTGKFECGSDTDTNTTYTAGRGLGLNGTSFSLNATITGSLVRFTTISGSTIYGKDSVNSSGSITAEGAISGSTLYAGTSIKGAGLVDCSTAGTSKLLWNSATGRFSCGTDTDTTSYFSTGNVLTIGSAKYVSKQGDTMTGALVIDIQGGTLGSIGLKVLNTLSGAILHAEKTLSSSGTIMARGNIWTKGGFSGATLEIGHGAFGSPSIKFGGTNDGIFHGGDNHFELVVGGLTAFQAFPSQVRIPRGTVSAPGMVWTDATTTGFFSGGSSFISASIIGAEKFRIDTTGIKIFSAASGSILHAEKTLTTSGTLVFEGAASGSSLYLGTSLNGAGLVDCSTAGTSKLLWNSATGRFSCGTDQNTGTAYTAGQGLSLNGTIVTLNSTISGSLIRFATVSGSLMHADKTLTTSGTLVFEGAASGSSLYIASSLQGAGLSDCSNAANSKLLWNSATGRFSCGTDQSAGSTYSIGQGLSINGSVITLNTSISGSLVRFTTISGSTIYGKDSVNSSGSITAEGAISGSTLFAGTSLKGAGLVDCSTAGTSKLLWNSASGRFSCGTDQNTGTTYTAGQGLNLNGTVVTLNATISGSLIRFTTVSGSIVFAKEQLNASGSLSVEGTSIFEGTTVLGDASSDSILFVGSVASNIVPIAANTGNLGSAANYWSQLYINTISTKGTISGAILHADKDLTTSGSLVFEGAASGSSLYLGTSLKGAGLIDCSTAGTSKLLWNAASGRFSCGTDQNTGTTYTAGQGLSLNGTIVTLNSTITGSLVRFTTISGSTVFARNLLASSGSVSIEGNLTGATINGFGLQSCNGASQKLLWNTATGKFECGADVDTDTNTTYTAGRGLGLNGTSFSLNATITGSLVRFTTISGSTIYGKDSVNSSGSITAEGAISGSTLFAGTSIKGAGLVDCSTAGTSKLLWNSATGRFSCGTDTDTDTNTTYTAGQGLSLNGTIVTLNSAISGSLVRFTTISGSTVFAKNLLASSGSLSIEGNLTGATINGFGLQACNSASQKLLWNTATGKFECGADVDTDTNTTYTAGRGLGLNGTSFSLNATITGSLVRFTTISGSTIYGKDSVNSSGSITAEGAISGSTLFAGTSIKGAGLVDCSTAGTSKLLWNSATGRFSCGTDTDTTSYFSTGNVLTIGSAKYVSKQGDTMTGALTINMQGGTLQTIGLKVMNTLSGAQIHAERNLTSSGGLIVRGTGSIQTGGAGQVGLRIMGAGSQSANLTEWVTSAGSKMLAVTSAGDLQQLTNGTWRIKDFSGNDIFSHTNGGLNTFGGGVVGSTFAFNTILGGTADVLAINPSINYAGNGAYTALAINITENNVPSGMRYLAHFKLGSVSKFAVTSTGSVGVGTATPGSRLSVSGAVIINPNGALGSATADAGLAMEIIGTASGQVLRAQNTLASSGTLVFEGAASGSSLYLGSALQGAGLTTCSNATTNKLLWDSSTGRFSCGTDQSGGAAFNSGQVITIGNGLFVKRTGDTMTGTLVIRSLSGSNAVGLNVIGIMSGIGLNVSGTGAQPLLRANPKTGTIIMGTGGIRTGSGHMFPQLLVGVKTPVLVGNTSTVAAIDHMALQGNTIISTAGTVLRSFDVTSPTGPKTLATANVTSSNPAAIAVQGKYAFIGVQIKIQSFDISNPSSMVPLHVFTPTSAVNALAIQGRYLYSLNTTSAKLQTVDISNPANMVSGGTVSTGTTPNAIAVQGRYAYITNGGSNTMQIIDLKNPWSPVSIGTTSAGTTPNGVAVQGRYVYVINTTGLQIFDVSNPASVITMGSVAVGTQSAIAVSGRYAYVVGSNGLQTIDITDARAPTLVSVVSSGLTTLNQISIAGRYAYVSYTGGTRLYVYDLGGVYTQNAEVGTLDAGSLTVRGMTQGMDASFQGSISAGTSLFVAGHASFGTGGQVTIGTGGLIARGPGFSGSSVYATASFAGAGLTDCDTAASSKLLWDATTGRFSCGTDTTTAYTAGQGLALNGTSFSLNTTITGSLVRFTTISGSTVYGKNSVNSSGSITAEGAISGSTLFAGTSISGAGLADCDTGATSKLLWDATTGRFSCGTDQTGGGSSTFSSGNVLTIGGQKYVSKQGDTMTGALVIKVSTATQTGALTVTNITRRGTGAYISSSGSVLVLNSTAGTVGSTQSRHILFGYAGNFDTALWRSAATVLSTNGTFSGATLYAANALRSSGSITAEGAISGATLYAGTSIKGAGLVSDCNTSTSALQWSSSTGRFSCGTISAGGTFSTGNVLTIGNQKYVSKQGDTMTGVLVTPALSLSGVLLGSGDGFNEYMNLVHSGLATKSITRLTAGGDLVNIGTIQARQTTLRTGGTFLAASNKFISHDPYYMALGDFTGDGKLDLAAASPLDGIINIFKNTGTGDLLFQTALTASFPTGMTVADFNNDGRADIAVADSSNMSVFLGNGDATFKVKTSYAAGTSPGDIASGDVNGDGAIDVVTPSSADNQVSVFLNTGRGIFASRVTYTIGTSGPTGIGMADFNGDNASDIVTINNTLNTISILMNKGNGTFAAQVEYGKGTATSNYPPAIADFSGDGKPDIAVVNTTDATISVFINVGNGTFATKVDYAAGSVPYKVVTEDVNGDGHPDLIVNSGGNNTVSVFINKGNGTFVSFVSYATTDGAQTLVAGDINSDGLADIVTGGISTSHINILINNSKPILFAGAGTGGMVGIGTMNPRAKLHVSSTTGFGTGAYIYSSGTVLALEARTQSGAKTPNIAFGYRGNFDTKITRTSTGSLTFASNTGVLLTLDTERADATGNVFQIISDATTSYGGPDENKVFRIQANGAVFTDGAVTSNGADYAEWFYSGNEKLKAGEVVCIDITKNNSVKRCVNEADANVMGVVSTNPAFIGNGITGADGIIPPGYALVGLIGQVPTKVKVSGTGAIRPGDALTAASTPGYARKALPGESTLGVALEGMTSGEGVVNVLISRRNSSLTVDAVGQKVLDTIASMKIGDEVQLMVASSLENLNVDEQIQAAVQNQVTNLQASAASIQSLQEQINELRSEIGDRRSGTGANVVTTSGSGTSNQQPVTSNLTADTLSLEKTLNTGGDAHIGGDLHLDGTLMASSLFVPNGLSIDGGASVIGNMAATTITASSGGTIDGTLTVNGDIRIHSGSLLFDSGATISTSRLIVENSVLILGNITIEGLSRFLGDVEIHGELRVSGRQAGTVTLPAGSTAVTVHFSTGFTAVPVITATPNDFVLTPWRVKPVTQTGFTIELSQSQNINVVFSWHALVGMEDSSVIAEATAIDASHVFPMGSDNIPVSGNLYWNACIRNIAILDSDGKPHSCARYHQDYTWTHPDLLIEFLWNTAVTPPLLHLPDGYTVEITEDADTIRDAFTAEEQTSSASSSLESSVETSSASSEASSAPSEASSVISETSVVTSSESSVSSDSSESSESSESSSIDPLDINPITTDAAESSSSESSAEQSATPDAVLAE